VVNMNILAINKQHSKLKVWYFKMPNIFILPPSDSRKVGTSCLKTIFKKTLIFTQIFLVNLIKIRTFKYELHQRIDTNPS